jgi:hypothetical protein
MQPSTQERVNLKTRSATVEASPFSNSNEVSSRAIFSISISIIDSFPLQVEPSQTPAGEAAIAVNFCGSPGAPVLRQVHDVQRQQAAFAGAALKFTGCMTRSRSHNLLPTSQF